MRFKPCWPTGLIRRMSIDGSFLNCSISASRFLVLREPLITATFIPQRVMILGRNVMLGYALKAEGTRAYALNVAMELGEDSEDNDFAALLLALLGEDRVSLVVMDQVTKAKFFRCKDGILLAAVFFGDHELRTL